MTDRDVFNGILLIAVGLVLVYGSIIYRLIDLILYIGVLITVFGVIKLIYIFFMRTSNSRNIPHAGLDLIKTFGSNSDVNKSSHANNRLRNYDNVNSGSVTSNFGDYISKSSSKFNTSKKQDPGNSKQVLRTNSVEDEKKLFKAPSRTKNSDSEVQRNYGFLERDSSQISPNTVYFTPNYEKPMKITRRPKRKPANKINLSNVPKRSNEISKALASVGTTETIYDNNVSEDSYSLMPKRIDEEVILPINEIDLDYEEPVYNLSQSENTVYNGTLYDESYEYSDTITPIHTESGDDYNWGDERDSQNIDEYVSSVDLLNNVDNLDSSKNNISSDLDSRVNHDLSDVSEVDKTYGESKEDINSLSKLKPKDKQATLTSTPSSAISNIIKDVADVDADAANVGGAGVANVGGAGVANVGGAGVANVGGAGVANVGSVDTISKKNESNLDKSIIIDPNNPESLPIPKLLNSYVICEKGILTSQEAFEEVASHSKEEILLEAPTIKDMGERFLSSISNIKTRVIIQEFDIEDISYTILLSSLIKKGVEIKVLPLVNSFNLIGDTSHALLISNSVDVEDFEYGAVYTDEDSIKNIKELFESSWELAKDLDINIEQNN